MRRQQWCWWNHGHSWNQWSRHSQPNFPKFGIQPWARVSQISCFFLVLFWSPCHFLFAGLKVQTSISGWPNFHKLCQVTHLWKALEKLWILMTTFCILVHCVCRNSWFSGFVTLTSKRHGRQVEMQRFYNSCFLCSKQWCDDINAKCEHSALQTWVW